MDTFEGLLQNWRSACSCNSVFDKVRDLSYGIVNCAGKSTVTGFITGAGKQFSDWSSFYRLFSNKRIQMDEVNKSVLNQGIECSPPSDHIVIHVDDTIVRKRGKKVAGTAWRRDPLGPPFHVNFVWAQRYLQLSLAVPDQNGNGSSRSIPIAFKHCPTPSKPKKDASEKEIKQFKEQQKQMRLNKVGADCIAEVRKNLNENGHSEKKMITCVDGSYTNGTVLKSLPENTILIGRIRKDAKFYLPAKEQKSKGRRKIYGEQQPTPEQIRQSDKIPWQKVNAYAAGKKHDFEIKKVSGLLWKKAGKDMKITVIVIRPLAYRLSKSSKTLYRKPAYLICTDDKLELQKIIQYYLWRWEVEVNIGEEKSIFGVGKAHVRSPESVETLPAFVTAVYATLNLAQIKSQLGKESSLPRPKWYPHKQGKRITTGDLLQNIKAQIYCKAIGMNFNHFVKMQNKVRSGQNPINSPIYSYFYTRAS